jgi:hypothetical protein
MLVAASREVGGAQIQNRGTLGGNVANASPAGDTLPVLAAANARIVLRNQRSARTVAFDSYYIGYRKSVRQPDELIVAIEIPRIDGAQWWRKVGTRRAQAISKIMVAGVRGRDVRVAFGSVRPTVVLASHAAAVLSRGGSNRRGASGFAAGYRPDRRCQVDRGVSREGRREPPRSVLEGDGVNGCKGAGVQGCRGALVLVLVLVPVLLLPVSSTAQDDPRDRLLSAVRAAMAPALPFPNSDEDGALPANGNTEALWMVRPLQPGDRSIEVIATRSTKSTKCARRGRWRRSKTTSRRPSGAPRFSTSAPSRKRSAPASHRTSTA